MIDIQAFKPELDELCRSFPVKRLGIFGSALTERFNRESDIDILVLFNSREDIDYFSIYFELKERLEKLFDREVDLIIDTPFKNPVFRNEVEKTRTTIYESRDT